jgi:uracil-DNA glycosylase family 4
MATSLHTIAEQVRVCTRCRLHESRTHAVPGEGDPRAPIVLIGEAPGRREDETGRPFMGPSGKFLDEMMTLAALARDRVFITSVTKCRPPGNRTPRADEIETCVAAHLRRQLAAIEPQVLVLLGAPAARGVLGIRITRLADLAGRWFDHEGCRVLVTYHPAAGMRFPPIREAMRKHFRGLREAAAP